MFTCIPTINFYHQAKYSNQKKLHTHLSFRIICSKITLLPQSQNKDTISLLW
jgi:hypothetical protein